MLFQQLFGIKKVMFYKIKLFGMFKVIPRLIEQTITN